MAKVLTERETIERSIITTYRKGIWSPFVLAVKKYRLIEKGDKIAVCISGGKDSMLLAKLMQELQNHGETEFDLRFIVMDPGYNKENRKKIEENAKLLGIPIEIFETDVFASSLAAAGDSPCYLCARMRRGYLYAKAKELGCNKIALGHHYNDVVETFMMNLFIEGRVGCFAPKSYLSRKEIWMIRPLVFAPESAIKSAIKRNNIEIVKSKCPADGKTKREEMKEFLRQKEYEDNGFTDRIFGALRRSGVDGWGKAADAADKR